MVYGDYATRRLVAAEETVFSSGSIYFISAYLAFWFLPSCYMLLISYANKPKYKWFILILAIYSVLYLIAGSRFRILKIGCAVYFIHTRLVGKFTKKDLKWIIPFILLIFILFSIIPVVRSSSFGSSNIIEITSEILDKNIIYTLLKQTGSSGLAIANTVMYCPSYVPFSNGMSIVGAITTCLPSILNPFSGYTFGTEKVFAPFYYGSIATGYDSSFIAEAYYNFGNLIFVLMFLYGLVLGKMENNIKKSFSSENAIKFFVTVYMYSELIYCIRSDTYVLLRYFIYYAMIPCFLAWLYTPKRQKTHKRRIT